MAGKKGKKSVTKRSFEEVMQTEDTSAHLEVVFHSTLPLLAVLSPDNRLYVFDVTTSKLVQNFPSVNFEATTTCVAWSKQSHSAGVRIQLLLSISFLLG